MDVDAYLMDEWKFDISFSRGPGICFRLECQVTQESSVHQPEHCCPHKQCLPVSPLPMSRHLASMVPKMGSLSLSSSLPLVCEDIEPLLSFVNLEPLVSSVQGQI